MADTGRPRALLTAVLYAVIAGLWILLSDLLVSLLPLGVQESVQSIKGVGFVLITAVALYLLVERYGEQTRRESMRTAALERMLSQVVGTVPIGMVVTTDDGAVIFMNDTAEELLGTSSADAAGQELEMVFSGDGRDAAVLGELFRVGRLDHIELEANTNRRARTLMAFAAPIDPSIPASGYSVALAEIGDVQRERERLQRQVGAYAFLIPALEAAAHASDESALFRRVADLAVQSGRYRGAWAVVLDRESSRYKTVASIGTGERTRETARFVEERTVRDPQAVESHIGGVDEVTVANDVTRDPANVWHPASLDDAFGSTATISVGCGGRTMGALTFFAAETGAFDVDELHMLHVLMSELSFAVGRMHLDRQRLSAEEASIGGDRAYRELFYHHPAPMWVYDLETLAFLAVNDSATVKYGYTQDEFLGMKISDIRPRDDIPRLLSNVQSVSEGFEDAGVWTHVAKDGREFPVHVYSHTIEWDGRPAELVMIIEVARIE